MRTNQRLLPTLIIFALLLPILLQGCSGTFNKAEVTVLEYLGSGTHMMYTARCDARTNDHARSITISDYLRPTLNVHIWEGSDTPIRQKMSETALILDIEQSKTKFGLISSRAGLGKSSMLTAIEAESCQSIPVFRLDSVQDLLPAVQIGQREGNAVLYGAEMAMQTGFGDSSARSLAELLSDHRALFLIDSLDQVSNDERAKVVAAINNLRKKYPDTALIMVFARTPVPASKFGLEGLDSYLSIRPLQCAQTQSRIRTLTGNEATARQFWAFAKDTTLDHKIETRESCTFTHMATHRDVIIASAVSKHLNYASSALPEGNETDLTRALVYELAVSSLLARGRIKLPFTNAEAIRVVDAIIDAKQPSLHARSLLFNPEDCSTSAPGDTIEKRKEICASFMLTALFRRVRGADLWQFENNGFVDLFLARWAARQVTVEGQIDCSKVAGMADLFRSNEVASFFLGTPAGKACATEALHTLHSNECSAADAAVLYDQGLPHGIMRKTILRDAKKPTGQAELDTFVAEVLKQLETD